jgi:hypothetical protein
MADGPVTERERQLFADGMSLGFGMAAKNSLIFMPYATAGGFFRGVKRGNKVAMWYVGQWYADDDVEWPPEAFPTELEDEL